MHKIFSKPFLIFVALNFFISITDATLSYSVPVYLEENIKSIFFVGAILSISSTFGIFFDMWVAGHLTEKKYIFFLKWMIVAAAALPLAVLILPAHMFTFVFIMIAWSIYYDFRDFSRYRFIQRHIPKHEHTNAWGTILTFQNLAAIAAPFIASMLLYKSLKMPFYTALLYVLLTTVIFVILLKTLKHKKNENNGQLGDNNIATVRSTKTEFKILRALIKTVWPMSLFQIAIMAIDVTFWTTGVLYAEKLKEIHPMGGLLLTFYALPSIVTGLIASKLTHHAQKERVVFILGTITGLSIIFLSYARQLPLILIFTLITSTFYTIAMVLVSAIFEDYLDRVAKERLENDVVSIRQVSANFAYSLGPILFGALGEIYGLHSPFLFAGAFLLGASLICLIFIPKHVKMHQKELVGIVAE